MAAATLGHAWRVMADIAYYGATRLWRVLTVGFESTDSAPLPTLSAARVRSPPTRRGTCQCLTRRVCVQVSEKSLISVVIPTFNEGDGAAVSVASALSDPNVEVVVADGGSSDATCDVAAAVGATVLRVDTDEWGVGRAACQNAGAAAASGDILLFLHGDTELPEGYGGAVRAALREGTTAIAAFSLRLRPPCAGIWLVEMAANARSRIRQIPYGDQGLALRRETYDALGGFDRIPLLEDVEMVLLARRRGGHVATLPLVATSSSRRWQRHGVIANSAHNQLVLLGRAVGVPYQRIAAWYYGSTATKTY